MWLHVNWCWQWWFGCSCQLTVMVWMFLSTDSDGLDVQVKLEQEWKPSSTISGKCSFAFLVPSTFFLFLKLHAVHKQKYMVWFGVSIHVCVLLLLSIYTYHALIDALCVSLSWTVGTVLYCPLVCPISLLLQSLFSFCFPFSISMWNDFHQNAEYWKQTHFRTRKYTICRCVHVLFSLGILQAWAVKGLRSHCKNLTFQSVMCTAWHLSVKTHFPDIHGALLSSRLFSLWQCGQSVLCGQIVFAVCGSVVRLCFLSLALVRLCLVCVVLRWDCVCCVTGIVTAWSDCVCVWQALWQHGQIVFVCDRHCDSMVWLCLLRDRHCDSVVRLCLLWDRRCDSVVRMCLLCDRHCGQIVFAVWQALWQCGASECSRSQVESQIWQLPQRQVWQVVSMQLVGSMQVVLFVV